MQYEELLKLINELNQSSEHTIEIIHKMLEIVFEISDDSDRWASGINAYRDAIRVLESLLNINQEYRRMVEAYVEVYMSYSEPIQSSLNVDRQYKGTKSENEGEPRKTADTVSRVEERRRALAEALRTGRPVRDAYGDSLKPVDEVAVADSSIVAPYDQLVGDGEPEGITVPPGKLAGGSPLHCRVCDNIVFSGAHFCPYCGCPVVIEKPNVKLQKVEFSAIAPKTLTKGDYTIINVIMYEESCRHIVDELIRTMDDPAQETRSGVQMVSEGAKIKVVLNSQDLLIEDNIETGTWQGDYLNFSFALQLPGNFKKRQILLTAVVYINDVIASKLKFVVKCSSRSEQKIAVSREDVFSAFISYASQDRNRVAAIIQGMKKARPDLDVFFDVDSLRSGDNWELALHEEIEKRDVLFLCWSHFARESKWVDEEWRYALEQKGVECIEPVPIEPPDVCPPPAELRHKHFNDKLLYIINA